MLLDIRVCSSPVVISRRQSLPPVGHQQPWVIAIRQSSLPVIASRQYHPSVIASRQYHPSVITRRQSFTPVRRHQSGVSHHQPPLPPVSHRQPSIVTSRQVPSVSHRQPSVITSRYRQHRWQECSIPYTRHQDSCMWIKSHSPLGVWRNASDARIQTKPFGVSAL